MSKLHDLSIATKLPLGIGLLLVALLGGMTWAAYVEVRRSNLSAASERVGSLSRQFAGLFDSSSELRAAPMRLVAADPAMGECLASKDPSACDRARKLLEEHGAENGQVRSMELWDPQGERVLFTGIEHAKEPAESTRSMVVSAAAGPPGLGPFRLEGETLCYRRIVAVKQGDATLGYLAEVRRIANNPQTAQQLSGLLGSNATLLLGTRGGLWHDLERAVPPPPAHLLEDSEPVEYSRGSGPRVLAQATPVAATPWFVAVEFPLAPLLVPAQAFLRRAAFFSSILVLVGVLAGWWFSARITRPLEVVTQAAESIAAGRARSRVTPTRSDELGRLQSSFNAMAGEVEDARQRLEDMARYYKLLFDESPLPMWVSDLESGHFLEVNEAALRHYGYSRAEFLARSLDDLAMAEEPPGEGRPPSSTAAEPERPRIVRHRCKDGRIRHVEVTQHALVARERKETLTLAHDVTERVEAERSSKESETARQRVNAEMEGRIAELAAAQAALRESERALRDKEARKSAVLEAAIDGIVTMDHQGLVIEFNPAAQRIFGLSPDRAIGKPLADLLVPPALRKQHREGLAHYLATRKGRLLGKRIEVPALRGDGAEFPAEISIVRVGNEEPPVFTGFIRDLTERKQLEAQLRQSQKMDAIGRLAGGVAHDFNNLLSVILGYCDLLVSDGGTKSQAELAEIQAAGQRGADLTRQLLAFSRQQVLLPQDIDLNQIVKGMDGMLRRLIGEDIELRIVTRASGLIHADPGQIEQILMNLVVNARDAMPSGGKLMLETSDADLDADYAADHPEVVPGDFVMLAVSDTGTGMDETTRNRAFEPFFTTKEKGKGTGLGLSTVFGIVKQSGGSIWVYSEPNEGTTFKIYLPRADRREPSQEERTSAARPHGLRGRETILLVEDDDQLRVLTRKILEQHGYDVLHADSGDHALRICEAHSAPIHLLLTDVVMPRMSGRELADRLRLARPEVKVLYMSGYTDDAIIRHGVLDHGIAFLQKPWTTRSLAKKLREVLEAS